MKHYFFDDFDLMPVMSALLASLIDDRANDGSRTYRLFN